MYSGSIIGAHKLFDKIPRETALSSNTMIEDYKKSENRAKSLESFDLMPHKNDYPWNVIISGIVSAGNVEIARRLFN